MFAFGFNTAFSSQNWLEKQNCFQAKLDSYLKSVPKVEYVFKQTKKTFG